MYKTIKKPNMINKITITCADDHVDPIELAELSASYPELELAILVSSANFGKPRYPSKEWIAKLVEIKRYYPRMKLAMHLCGEYSRQLIAGDARPLVDMFSLMCKCDRVQINSRAIPFDSYVPLVGALLTKRPEFIFQYRQGVEGLVSMAEAHGINASILYDGSGGRGIEPATWEPPIDGILTGYAGGITPENIQGHIEQINQVSGNTPVWIDMETGVRTNNMFDLDKVSTCLHIASEYINV